MVLLEQNLQPKQENKKENTLDIFKTLFDKIGIETKTELTQKQIVLINQKLAISDLLGFKELRHILTNFMILQVSKDRKGRSEFVEGIKAEYNREERQQTNALNNIFGGKNNN